MIVKNAAKRTCASKLKKKLTKQVKRISTVSNTQSFKETFRRKVPQCKCVTKVTEWAKGHEEFSQSDTDTVSFVINTIILQ